MDQLKYLEELYGEQESGIPVMDSSLIVLAPGNHVAEVPPFLLDHAPFTGEEGV